MPTRKLDDGTKAYGRRWERESKQFLAVNGYCVMCIDQGLAVRATVVDHIVRHRYVAALFWDRSNWQPLCKRCHDSTKKRIEGRAEKRKRWAGVDGMPRDPSHPWARRAVH